MISLVLLCVISSVLARWFFFAFFLPLRALPSAAYYMRLLIAIIYSRVLFGKLHASFLPGSVL
ncbi:hypothetical protein CLM71_16290 [Serratia sp. MYb239]|uniref:hypothetical protein n=1 Tax=Serratia sp. MYb239 TaxID=2033438 RepID=UPI000CF5EE88|nr:hypothetical protein [Serratia sp. MYb239]AVJ18576.1 hypothetical protein CLM71_16290 [Serratia sp. MYb239]QPT12132.1 hypothetical protein I6G37_16710 [Serratia rubidaea]